MGPGPVVTVDPVIGVRVWGQKKPPLPRGLASGREVTPITGLFGRGLVIDPTGTIGQARAADAILTVGTGCTIDAALTLYALGTIDAGQTIGTKVTVG